MNIDNFNWNKIWHRRLVHFYHKDSNKYLKEHDINVRKCPECRVSKMKRFPHNINPLQKKLKS